MDSLPIQSLTSRSQPDIQEANLIDLCDICKSLDLDEIFGSPLVAASVPIADLQKTPEELRGSHCPLCALFGAMIFSNDAASLHLSKPCHLRAFSSRRALTHMRGKLTDVAVLGVVHDTFDQTLDEEDQFLLSRQTTEKTGYLFSDQSFHQARRDSVVVDIRPVMTCAFDVDFIKASLRFCQDHHRNTCCAHQYDQPQNIRVIDCLTRTIINLPQECQYVALSYVWGLPQSPPATSTHQVMFEDAPKVILDCFEIVVLLGHRYLWIDRYCIDQYNEADKRTQIRQMDLIYMNATCTIIAAAGTDPHHGLPGVRGTRRKEQPRLTVGKHTLMSTLPSIRAAVNSSKWMSRGWTYQEGLLSRRRIIFTDYQVYYECNGMHLGECLRMDLTKLHIKSKARFREAVVPGVFEFKLPGSDPADILSYITEFNQRDLTFEQDALKAMQGVFNLFAFASKPMYQLQGVPIPNKRMILGETSKWVIGVPVSSIRIETDENSYENAPLTAEEGFLMGLFWSHVSPGKRRSSLPSWSWAGWTGKLDVSFALFKQTLVGFGDYPDFPNPPHRHQGVKIYVERTSEELVRFPEWKSLDELLAGPFSQSSVLHIEALTLTVTIIYISQEYTDHNWASENFPIAKVPAPGFYATISLNSNTRVYRNIRLDGEISGLKTCDPSEPAMNDATYFCILVQGSFRDSALVCQNHGMYAQRIGILGLSLAWHEEGIWTDKPSFDTLGRTLRTGGEEWRTTRLR